MKLSDLPQPEVDLRLAKHKKQFQTGTIIVLSGAVVAAGAIIVNNIQAYDSSLDGNYHVSEAKKLRPAYIGIGIVTVGMAVQIDSFKYLNPKRKKK